MGVLIGLIIGIFFLPLIAVMIYLKIQLAKKVKPPKIPSDFQSFNEIQSNIEDCFKSANGWLNLVVLYLSSYYVFNIWSVCFSFLTFFVVSFENHAGKGDMFALSISLCAALSLLATVLNLVINPKDMFVRMNKSWNRAWVLVMNFKIDIINKTENEVISAVRKLQNDIMEISGNTEFV
ncbi:MAG: hypothetical protein ACLRP9_01880 [Anaerovoracaceae bacterium]